MAFIHQMFALFFLVETRTSGERRNVGIWLSSIPAQTPRQNKMCWLKLRKPENCERYKQNANDRMANIQARKRSILPKKSSADCAWRRNSAFIASAEYKYFGASNTTTVPFYFLSNCLISELWCDVAVRSRKKKNKKKQPQKKRR